jgi:hypothetical protein
MERFRMLARVDPESDDVALVEHAFPGRFDLDALRALGPEAMWQRVYAALRAAEPGPVGDHGPDAALVRRGSRYYMHDVRIGKRYAPARIYAGEVAMFVARGHAWHAERWRPFLQRPPEVHEFDLQANAGKSDPHDAMMREKNVALMAGELNRLLGPA